MLDGRGIEDDAAAQSFDRREAAQDELGPRPRERAATRGGSARTTNPRRNLSGREEDDAAHRLSRSEVDPDARSHLDSRGPLLEEPDVDVDEARRLELAGAGQDVAPLDLVLFHALQVDGGSLAGRDLDNLQPVRLEPADARREARREDDDRLLLAQASRDERAGHDRPGNPLTVKTRSMGRRRGPSAGRARISAPSSWIVSTRWGRPAPVLDETGTIGASSRNVLDRSADLLGHGASHSGSTRSVFVTATRPRGDAEEIADRQVLARLRHDPSSAATTSMTRSIPPTPASMFRISFS